MFRVYDLNFRVELYGNVRNAMDAGCTWGLSKVNYLEYEFWGFRGVGNMDQGLRD